MELLLYGREVLTNVVLYLRICLSLSLWLLDLIKVLLRRKAENIKPRLVLRREESNFNSSINELASLTLQFAAKTLTVNNLSGNVVNAANNVSGENLFCHFLAIKNLQNLFLLI